MKIKFKQWLHPQMGIVPVDPKTPLVLEAEIVEENSVRVGHLHIQRHPERGIQLTHDNGEAMQTDEDKFYQHLMDYWNKEF